MTQDHTTSASVCYRHPDRQTMLRCSRCDRPICVDCSTDAAVGQRCPECMKAEGVQKVIPTGPRRRSRIAAAGAPATVTIIGLCVFVYLLGYLGLSNQLVQHLAQINFAVAQGEWWRIFTVTLLHASVTHILFNMWALWVLGPQIERGLGRWPFVSLYLASAGVGGACAYFFGQLGDVGVGASGAIFGLFGVWLSWALHRRGTMQGRAILGQLLFLLAINAAIPFLFANISWQAHLGGLLTGFVIGEIWSRITGPNSERSRTLVALGVAVLAVVAVTI